MNFEWTTAGQEVNNSQFQTILPSFEVKFFWTKNVNNNAAMEGGSQVLHFFISSYHIPFVSNHQGQFVQKNIFKCFTSNFRCKKIFLYQRYRVWCFWWNWLNSRYVQFHFKRWAASNASLWQFCSLCKLDQIHSHFSFLTICWKFLRKKCCKLEKKIRFTSWRKFF